MDQPLLQPTAALAFLYCGILMGIVYGLFDTLQSSLHPIFLRHLFDGICAILLGLLFAYASFVILGGTLRLYAFLAAVFGFLIERNTLHALLCAIRSKRIHKSSSHLK